MANRIAEKTPILCCLNPDIVHDNGYSVCVNCGLVHEDAQFQNTETRAYSVDEISARKRTEVRIRTFGTRTIINVHGDAHKCCMNSKQVQQYSRLAKINGSLINSMERNLWEAYPKAKQICDLVSLPDYVFETAWKIYTQCAKNKYTMGRTIEGFICASIIISVRINRFPRFMEQIMENTEIDKKTINNCVSLINRFILPNLKIKYLPIDIKPVISSLANELKMSMLIQNRIVNLFKFVKRRGYSVCGKNPKGIVAGLIYIYSRQAHLGFTQTNIAKIAKITEVTLRTRTKQMKKYITPNYLTHLIQVLPKGQMILEANNQCI